MSTTQKDIARRVDMSTKSVARALQGNPLVSAESRRRVLEVARELGYDENSNKNARALVARRLNRQVKHNVIAVVLSCNPLLQADPYYAELLDGVEFATSELGIDVFLFRRGRGELPRLVRDGEVDGVISFFSNELLESQFLNVHVPVVTMAVGTDLHHNLIPDGYGGICLATQYLIDLGHRQIAYVGFMTDFPEGGDRFRAYRDTLEKNGIAVNEQLVNKSLVRGLPSYASAAIDLILEDDVRFKNDGRPGFTAVVCYNDAHAEGVLGRLRQLGLDVPGDVSITGFDNTSSQRLTSIEFDRLAMGARAVEIIQAFADSGKIPQKLIKETFPVELRAGESTAPPRER